MSGSRPPSRASSLLQGNCVQPIGRALARLHLILIHPPLREAEWRCSSGDWRAAPCGEAAHIACRCSEANRRAMPPDECRSEGTPSPSEGPDAWGEPFGSFLAFEKGTRRQGETLSGRYRSNGYVLNQPEPGRLSGRHRWQASSHRNWGIRKNEVVCQAAFASKPAPTGGSGTSARDWSTVRPSSPAGWLPQDILPQRIGST